VVVHAIDEQPPALIEAWSGPPLHLVVLEAILEAAG
jgi:hypothetical protein